MTTPIEDRIKAEAKAHGFSLVGIAPATAADGFGRFCDWLDRGFAGEMDYLQEHRENRRHPAAVLEEVRSVVMLGMEYGGENSGGVAKYAQHRDYHPFLWKKLNAMRDWLAVEVPGSVSHGATDSAPLLERDFARRAGLGWFGKNTMLINKHRGSFFIIAAFLTSLDLQPDAPHMASHCGTCTACLDACPTQAFPEPGILDARKCISYLTIELRGAIPLELREGVGDWLFGCDVCQDVCPWNRDSPNENPAFPTDPALILLNPIEILSLTKRQFLKRFEKTSIGRTRRTGLLRNAAIVLGNTGDEQAIPALKQASQDTDPVIAEAARWALQRIQDRHNLLPSHNLADC